VWCDFFMDAVCGACVFFVVCVCVVFVYCLCVWCMWCDVWVVCFCVLVGVEFACLCFGVCCVCGLKRV